MLTATRTGRFRSWDYVVEQDGTQVAELPAALLEEAGSVVIGGREHTIGWVGDRFVLAEGEHIVAEAYPAHDKLELRAQERVYGFALSSFRGRDGVLTQQDQKAGRTKEKGRWRRAVQADLPAEMSLEVRVFVVWLTIQLWKDPRAVQRRGAGTSLNDVVTTLLPDLGDLTPDQVAELTAGAQALLDDKTWTGCGGLTLTDEMRMTIAVHAARIAVGYPGYRFPNLTTLLVYPGGFFVRGEDGSQLLDGIASSTGSVAVSWHEDQPHRTAEVVIHELAHMFDMLEGEADGKPPILDRELRATWNGTFQGEFERFAAQVEAGQESVIPELASASPSEFFAGASEAFFLAPQELASERPRLFDLFRQWYRQDTLAAWTGRSAADRPKEHRPAGERVSEEELAEAQELVRRQPDYADGWAVLGYSYGHLERWEEAVGAWSALLELQSTNAEAYHMRGDALALLKRGDEALRDFERAIELDPDVPLGYASRASLHVEHGNYPDAKADVDRAIELDPGDASLWVQRAHVRLMQDDVAGAREDAGRALELDPKDAGTYSFVAKVLLDAEDPVGAEQNALQALELDPLDQVALQVLGDCAYDAEDYSRALEYAERAIEIRESQRLVPFPSQWTDRGYARLRSGDLDGALQDAERAIELDNDRYEAYKLRAEIQFSRGDLEPALTNCNEAVRLYPDYQKAFALRAQIHTAAGRFDEAAADEARAQELDEGS